ncbi:hypothetical protein [Streptomyces sp. NPDC088766]|uniref:hypothetical protein n=1 Tax=Streptomyces sp. NPDC088766 TaxID=3365893 RepID=UPI00382D2494
MPHHALEILLTRPLTQAELHHAARTVPLAANHDATRLMALWPAKTPHRAAHRLRRRLNGRLPIDVITTHYADPDGNILINIAFPPATHTLIQQAAQHAGHSPERFLTQSVHHALARHATDESARLNRAVQELLTSTTLAHLLAAVGHALTRDTGAAP